MATAKALTPEQMDKAASALVAATQNQATSNGKQIESDAAQLAPGLATGSNAPGGYNYQAYIAPTVPALTAQFVTQAKQGALSGAMRDALNAANIRYNKAQNDYQARQRQYNLDSARQAQEARQEAEREARAQAAAQAAYYASMTNNNLSDVTVTPTVKPRITSVQTTTNPQRTASGKKLQKTINGTSLQGGSGSLLQRSNASWIQ